MRNLVCSAGAALALGLSGSAAAAVDLDEFGNQDLSQDWRATAVLGGDVIGSNGNLIGNVHEMILGDDGLVQSIVVTRSPDNSLDNEYLTVQWAKVDFEPEHGNARVEFSADAADDKSWSELPPIAGAGEQKASRLIGMDVDSTDDVPEGEVEDVLISQGANDMSAFVVESAVDGETYYALPGDPEFIDYEEGELDLPYTARGIEDLPELEY